ncbi:MAG: hypothetical protein NC302_12295 [Bacteroidales bacterium]|nr:hypothetical protein [Bacteroidales bacterium]MCM1416480.1 hypothetical protein [bacterium]MCM1424574.1 hypothetical protein [bacterium]
MSENRSLYQMLREYSAGDVYPCHMPGHKRNPAGGEMAAYFDIDITEIEGFDDLHHAAGILKEAQERANRLYGAEETFFLVNGSTGGILAAVMAAVLPGGEILIARNCHRAVYHAALMQDLKVHYCMPQPIEAYDICGGVSAAEIGVILDDNPQIEAVVITSPTYEGILSDVAGIAAAVHERGKILIVDEAHGAHLGLLAEENALRDGFDAEKGAVAAGADLVIHSLHKTLPSMTQTALLHVNGSRVDRDRLRSYLAMVQSSSPSYVLMASIDACVRFLEKEGKERFAFFGEQRKKFDKKTQNLRHLHIGKMTGVSDHASVGWDIGKILISVKDADMTGKQLADLLRETWHIELEMAAASYGLAIMTLMDTAQGWQRLADALCEIDDRIEKERGGAPMRRMPGNAAALPEAIMTLAQAFHSGHEEVPLSDAAGRISADFICLYPPGIPLAAPGERLTQTLLHDIAASTQKGLTVQGLSSAGKISVVVEIPEKMWHY